MNPAFVPRIARGAACGVLLALGASPAPARPALVPEPADIASVEGAATLGPRWAVRVPAGSAADSFAASLLIEDVRVRFGWRWSIDDREGPAVILRPVRPSHRATELWTRQGYELEVWPDSIVIRAPTEAGRYYGVQTLRQIVRGPRAPYVPGMIVRDGPELAWRGLAENVSHGQVPTLEEFRRTIAALGYWKANVYALAVAEAFEYAGAPAIGRGRSRLTAAEMAAIVAEGRRHHVTVIPVFDVLSERLQAPGDVLDARGRPAPLWSWARTGAAVGGWLQGLLLGRESEASSWMPLTPETRAFVRARMFELSEAAPGPWFALEAGGGHGDSVLRAHGPGIAALVADLADDLFRRQRRTVMDAGLAALDGSRIPRNAVVTWRGGDGGNPSAALLKLRSAGFASVRAAPALGEAASFLPRPGRDFAGIGRMLAGGLEARAEGLIAEPTAGTPGSLRTLDGIGMAYAADAGWSGTADSTREFLSRYATVHFGSRSRTAGPALIAMSALEPPREWDASFFSLPPDTAARAAESLVRARTLEREAGRARRTLLAEARLARWNAGELECWAHAMRRLEWLARREVSLHEIGRALAAPPRRRARRADSPERRLAALRDESAAMAAELEKLWRERYRVDGLRVALNRMERPAHELDALRAALIPAPVQAPRAAVASAAPTPRVVSARSARRARAMSTAGLELSVSQGY